MSFSRVVVWFSCGAASAAAAFYALQKYSLEDVWIVYCDTSKSEHPDNQRFLQDVSVWLRHPIKIIRSRHFDSIDDVFMSTRYMAGINGARCTVEMKKKPRFDFQLPSDIHIFGYTCEEWKRVAAFERNNFDLNLDWVLLDRNITKEDCFQLLVNAGVALPVRYEQGYKNNNCTGCVKATSPQYWALVRQTDPDVFARRAAQSRELGVRLCRYKGERIFLDELPLHVGGKVTESISCGPECSSDL